MIDEWGGVDFSDVNLDGIFTRPTEYPDRRTGFVGDENLTGEGALDDRAPLSMGYSDLHRNSMPREDNVAMLEDQRFLPRNPQPPGIFANASIMHASKIDNDFGD